MQLPHFKYSELLKVRPDWLFCIHSLLLQAPSPSDELVLKKKLIIKKNSEDYGFCPSSSSSNAATHGSSIISSEIHHAVILFFFLLPVISYSKDFWIFFFFFDLVFVQSHLSHCTSASATVHPMHRGCMDTQTWMLNTMAV